MISLVEEINAKIRNVWLQLLLIIKNKRRDDMLKRLNSLRSYYNRNGNFAGNLYDATFVGLYQYVILQR